MSCKHERWLYNLGDNVGDGVIYFNDNWFLCADCGSWIGLGSVYPVEKIINVKHLPKDDCPHDITFYTLQSAAVCLRCGYSGRPEPVKLDIKTDLTWINRDKERRQRILEKYADGEIY